jgi:hypothetical protein
VAHTRQLNKLCSSSKGTPGVHTSGTAGTAAADLVAAARSQLAILNHAGRLNLADTAQAQETATGKSVLEMLW